ncbi:hypothetical protein GCM10025783_21300 [Amnibacterium soli]|uniref:Uncharacterized protein n=1 Tax=Amnibacterium soli TaxID=1282736 RepID=A0ABP8Z8K6_9MICO
MLHRAARRLLLLGPCEPQRVDVPQDHVLEPHADVLPRRGGALPGPENLRRTARGTADPYPGTGQELAPAGDVPEPSDS